MKIVSLYAENFKRLSAVEIAPNGNVITIAGRNGQGKSSILDAIWVALVGKKVAPPKPIRDGTEKATIRLDVGEFIITRTFNMTKEGKPTESVKIESADGRTKFNKPETMLAELMGAIGFDPFAFVQKSPADQAAMLLELVPLSVDLDEHAELDTQTRADRVQIGRERDALDGQIQAIPDRRDLPEVLVDRQAIIDQITNAADENTKVERERLARQGTSQRIQDIRDDAASRDREAAQLRERAQQLIDEAEAAEKTAESGRKEADRLEAELAALSPLRDLVDTAALRTQLQEAEETNRLIGERNAKVELQKQRDVLHAQYEAHTGALQKRETERREALAKAKMPIAGLGFEINEKGKPAVTFGGVPFEQASSAEQLRAATAIAMAANPTLRVLRVKDGALLDEQSMQMLTEMAEAEDFQLWCEVVRPDSEVAIVIEDGMIVPPKKQDGKLL